MRTAMRIRDIVERVVELGLVSPTILRRQLDSCVYHETLDYYGDSEPEALLTLLHELGIRYTTDFKTFRGICEDGHRPEQWYRDELAQIAACTRGAITITGITVTDDSYGDHVLRFWCNERPVEWSMLHGADEDFETQLVFATHLGDIFANHSPARWCSVDPQDPDVGSDAVFGDPRALCLLGAPFGLSFQPWPVATGLREPVAKLTVIR